MHGELVRGRDRARGPVLAGQPVRPRFRRVDFLVGLLAERAEDLGEPYTRHLGGKVGELRFHLLRQQTRVTYWLAPGRRVILLTVFRKTRSAETAEVARALHAQMTCETRHSRAHEVFDREVT
jgi:phage-related protein